MLFDRGNAFFFCISLIPEYFFIGAYYLLIGNNIIESTGLFLPSVDWKKFNIKFNNSQYQILCGGDLSLVLDSDLMFKISHKYHVEYFIHLFLILKVEYFPLVGTIIWSPRVRR